MPAMSNGRILLIFNMPFPLASALIAWANREDQHCDHCAIQLGNTIYESTIPVVRKLTWQDYDTQLKEWAKDKPKWRKDKDRPLYVENWTLPGGFSQEQLDLMTAEAEKWIGSRYRMVLNYMYKLKTTHCSEYCGRILEAGRFVEWNKEHSRIQPYDIHRMLVWLGWNLERLDY